ncbi:MAG: flavodoxin family protein [Verrucomicrobia bacterium]|nr:flavodoxin family protein [Verrucomicrobiota bacterium]
MKILVFNSSPRKERGMTAALLGPFLDGAKEAGAEIELVYVADLKVKPCLGCFYCWLKTPGRCVQKDDMAGVLEKVVGSDVLVLGTPLYVDGMTGTMKMMLDRFIPLALPFFELVDGRTRHPGRYGRHDARVVLVSVSGFPEVENFSGLIEHVKAICANMHGAFAGAVLRPGAPLIPFLKQQGVPVEDAFDAAREAGRQLVRDGAMSPGTLAAVSRDLAPREAIHQGANAYFKQVLEIRDRHEWH